MDEEAQILTKSIKVLLLVSTAVETIVHAQTKNRVANRIKSTVNAKPEASKLTAAHLVDDLIRLTSSAKHSITYHPKHTIDQKSLPAVSMKAIFDLARQYKQMSLDEVEALLEHDQHLVRVGAVSIMDFQAREKNVSEAHKKALYALYIRRHDRINTWDLVDRSAPYVIGGYLFDKSRAPLYKLAKSKSPWEKRTAIVSTWFFIRQNDIEDTFKIAEILVHDSHEAVNKAVGSWVREAGKRDNGRLLNFLHKYAASMPRVTLRYAIEKLDAKQKKEFMSL